MATGKKVSAKEREHVRETFVKLAAVTGVELKDADVLADAFVQGMESYTPPDPNYRPHGRYQESK